MQWRSIEFTQDLDFLLSRAFCGELDGSHEGAPVVGAARCRFRIALITTQPRSPRAPSTNFPSTALPLLPPWPRSPRISSHAKAIETENPSTGSTTTTTTTTTTSTTAAMDPLRPLPLQRIPYLQGTYCSPQIELSREVAFVVG